MLKIRGAILSIIFILVSSRYARAQVVTLKSGKVIDGEIVERAKDYIKVKYDGQEIYYENKYIKNIEAQNAPELAVIAQKEKAVQDPMPSFKNAIELASAGNFGQARQEFQKQLNDINGGLNILDAAEKGSISKEYAIYLFQGSLHMINGEYNSAITSLEKAWEINPKDPDLNYNLGSAYFSLGEYKKSIAYLSAVLKLQPLDTEARELLTRAYHGQS
ncbi:MAG: tetratricopeptide repeat protein [Candidatus Omnitrophica bacterium]|nr:tetratricopeptide repeat protein [Candidatus Omnitrophota bacterium]